MRLLVSPIPDGSHEVAVWVDLPPGDCDTGEDIDTVCNLHRISATECLVTKCKGQLSDAVNIAIGLEAIALGYERLRLKVTTGTTVSRWLIYEKTESGMDYYRADLHAVLAQLEDAG